MDEVIKKSVGSASATASAGGAPDGLLAKHRGRRRAFFLDRGRGQLPSFAGSEPSAVLVVTHDGTVVIDDAEGRRHLDQHPIDAIDNFIDSNRADVRLPADWPSTTLPRTVGYLGYELGSCIERVARSAHDPVGAPLAVLATYDRVDGWNPTTRQSITVTFDHEQTSSAPLQHIQRCPTTPRLPDDADRSYAEGFTRIKRAIGAGEIYQANLSRCMRIALDEDPIDIYLRLRARQPVPYGAYLDAGCARLLSNSPECFLRIAGETIKTFPIKGTRPRATDAARDRELAAELAADPKELAEHLMIVDLERNDLGRICRIGSVAVPTYAAVESFATLHHLVSEVRGTLRDDCSIADILRATFPGGSITGAPKIQAMRTIAEVEPVARGVYTGAIGCFNGTRSAELAIAIRTAVATDDALYYNSGGGIVADSRLDAEYAETVTKARAFIDAVGMIGLDRAVAS